MLHSSQPGGRAASWSVMVYTLGPRLPRSIYRKYRMPIIATHNLFKQFGTGDVAVEVLRGVNLTIESGEFVAVMGPSGSGKSTLMSIIGGIEPPTSGHVIIDGVDIANLNDDQRTIMRRRKIGIRYFR